MDITNNSPRKEEGLRENLMPFTQANCSLLNFKIITPDIYLTSFSIVCFRQTYKINISIKIRAHYKGIKSSNVLIPPFSFVVSFCKLISRSSTGICFNFFGSIFEIMKFSYSSTRLMETVLKMTLWGFKSIFFLHSECQSQLHFPTSALPSICDRSFRRPRPT